MEKELINDYLFFLLFKEIKKEFRSSLDLSQYSLLIEALIKGIGTENDGFYSKESLLNLCKVLWLSKSEHDDNFTNIFNRHFDSNELKFTQIFISKQEEDGKPREVEKLENEIQTNQSPEIESPTVKDEKREGKKTQNSENPQATDKNHFKEINIGFEQLGGNSKLKKISSQLSQEQVDNKFLFGNFFPIKERRLKQYLRYSKNRTVKTISSNIDIQKTVEETASLGGFPNIFFAKEFSFFDKCILFIDKGDTMIGFHEFSNFIRKSIQASPISINLKEYYFEGFDRNGYYERSKFVLEEEILSQLNKQSIIIIMSDAGAAKGARNDSLVIDIIRFLESIKGRTNRILWLNPVPRKRWSGTPAFFLPLHVKAIELTKDGISMLPRLMKEI